jgi:hypothetical protein
MLYLAVDPTQVGVILIPFNTLWKLELAVGRGGGEGRENVFASVEPEEGFLQYVCFLLSQVRPEVHFLAERASVLRLHLLRY